MKKSIRIFSVLFLICCLAGLFAACGNKTAIIKNGTYYLTDNENSYIVLSEATVSFHNVNFSKVNQDISGHFGEAIDVAEVLAGEQLYDTNKTKDKIYVQIFDIVYLTLRYDSSEKSLSMAGQKFILQEA